MALPNGTVTFLLSDIEASTHGREADRAAMAAAVVRHYEILDAQISAAGGARPVEQGEGDSVVAAFARARDAVAAAVAIQRAFAAEPWPGGLAPAVRIALHTGDAELRDEGNYFGPTIIRCARLRALAHGGQIVCSRATADTVADALPDGAFLCDLGTHRLKDLARPEHVFGVQHAHLRGDFPPLRSAGQAHPLPVAPTSFVGRRAELAELTELADWHRMVTLTGTGGVGKTRLAVQAAAEVAERHADGVAFVDLAPLTDPDLVAETVLTVLGVGDVSGSSAIVRLRNHLNARDLLLVLDNCEHVVEGCAPVVVALLDGCPGVRVLATSREALGVAGEVVWQVPSMGADGVRLFVERAVQVRPNFASDDEALLREICARLDGIPLAIELAAARSRSLTSRQILTQLEDRFRLLTGRARGTLGRQRTLEASVAWSHDLLTEDERRLFRRLAVFAGGFTLDAAEAVASAAGPGLGVGAVLDLLDALVAKSMVAVVDDAEGRYRLLESLRAFAAAELERAGESVAAREAHLAYFLEFLRAGEFGVDGANPVRIRRFVVDQDNCRVAVDWSLSGSSTDRSVELVRHLGFALAGRGRYREAHDWARRAAELPGLSAQPAAVQIDALMTLGASQIAVADVAGLTVTAAQAMTLLDAEASARTRAQALHLQARLAVFLGDPATARAALDAAQPFAEEADEYFSLLDLPCCRLLVAMRSDDLTDARDLVDAALAVARRHDSHFYLVWDRCIESLLALRAGDFGAAGAAATECSRLAAGMGDVQAAYTSTGVLASLELLGGNPDSALALVDSVIPTVVGEGGYSFLAYLMTIRGRVLAALGAPDAEAALVEACATAERLQDPWQIAHGALACARFVVDRYEEVTARYLETARACAATIGSPYVAAAADHLDAVLAASRGDVGRAEDLAHAALAVHVAQGYALDVVDVLETLACLAVRSESRLEAARLFGAAATRRQELGYRLVAPDTASARAVVLGEEECATAMREGTSMGVDAAVAYASRARGERGRPSFGWAALTPMELEVARLVAGGIENAEIGRRLFVSVNTVKTHLSRTYAKLGLTSRAELAAEVTRRGG